MLNQILLYCTAGMSRYLIFAFLTLCDVTDDATVVMLGHQRSLSITSDQIEIESQERHHCARTELPNRLICDLTPPPSSIHDLKVCNLTLTSLSTWTLTLPNKKYITRRGLMRGLRWCLHFGSTTTFGGFMSKKTDPWVSDLT